MVYKHSHKPKSQIHPNSSLSQIQNQRTKYEPKNLRFTNTKKEFCTNQRESHKSNPKIATNQERVDHQTAKPKPSRHKISLTIPNCNSQISKNQNMREPLFLTHTLYKFASIALCLYRRLELASISKTKKD